MYVHDTTNASETQTDFRTSDTGSACGSAPRPRRGTGAGPQRLRFRVDVGHRSYVVGASSSELLAHFLHLTISEIDRRYLDDVAWRAWRLGYVRRQRLQLLVRRVDG